MTVEIDTGCLTSRLIRQSVKRGLFPPDQIVSLLTSTLLKFHVLQPQKRYSYGFWCSRKLNESSEATNLKDKVWILKNYNEEKTKPYLKPASRALEIQGKGYFTLERELFITSVWSWGKHQTHLALRGSSKPSEIKES